jgi:hypothetical protein
MHPMLGDIRRPVGKFGGMERSIYFYPLLLPFSFELFRCSFYLKIVILNCFISPPCKKLPAPTLSLS